MLLTMIFLHIVDDYYLQGWLASAKQKKWWLENSPNKLYNYDDCYNFLMNSALDSKDYEWVKEIKEMKN